MAPRFVVFPLALLLFTGCPGPHQADPNDAGSTGSGNLLPALRDSGPPASRDDAGVASPDGGIERDAGRPDAGTTPTTDAGDEPTFDAGVAPDVDAGTPDAGTPDAGPPPEFIAARGEPCYPAGGTGCEAGLVCVSVFTSGAGTCEYPCDVEGQACPTGGTCTDFGAEGVPELACAEQVGAGAGCDVEKLVVCAGDGACLQNDNDPLGGTCRTPCACAAGTSCTSAACGTDTCVVVDLSSGAGYCGEAVAVGEACSPVDDGLFCEGTAAGAAICILDVTTPEAGVCRQRCDDAADCSAWPNHACFGEAPDGLCLPTTNRGPGEICTLAGTTPTLGCQTGLDCVRVHDDLTAGYGVCLQACAAPGDCTRAGESCFNLPETDFPGVGPRCLRELPRGAHGCDPPEPLCVGDDGTCVTLSDGDSICKISCDLAACAAGSCTCGPGESCIPNFLASDTIGVCGRQVGLDEPCDEDADVYCAPAPGEATPGNAFSTCVDRCVFVCHYEPQGQPAVDLACPSGLECRPDPTGRLLPTVHICVDTGS